MDQLESQIAKSCLAIHTTAWGCGHGCLPLAHPDAALTRATGGALTNCNLSQPSKVNSAIKNDTSDFDQLALKADKDVLWTGWWIQLAVTAIEVELIVSSVDAQYIKELEED